MLVLFAGGTILTLYDTQAPVAESQHPEAWPAREGYFSVPLFHVESAIISEFSWITSIGFVVRLYLGLTRKFK